MLFDAIMSMHDDWSCGDHVHYYYASIHVRLAANCRAACRFHALQQQHPPQREKRIMNRNRYEQKESHSKLQMDAMHCVREHIPVDDMSFKVGFDVLNIDVPDALNRGLELSIKRAKTRKQLDAVPRSVSQSMVLCWRRLRR